MQGAFKAIIELKKKNNYERNNNPTRISRQ